MDSGNRSTVRLCARRTGLNFKGRQSGGILGRPSVWKWPVARAAVFSAFARCRSILSCRRHSPEQKQDPPAPPVFPESGSCTQVCKLPLVDLVMVTWILEKRVAPVDPASARANAGGRTRLSGTEQRPRRLP